ncbi:MAG: ketoacyl-ACP synthase III [Bacteroidota bacterium]
MARFNLSGIGLRGVAAAVPAQREDNAALDALPESRRQELIRTTGIRYRHIAREDQCASDLCVAAAERLLQELSWAPDSIDVLVMVTQTPDHPLPGPASHVQHRLGLRTSTVVLDINHGCAGYVYGLSVIGSLMAASGLKKGLLLVGDTITRTIADSDYSLRPIFSDSGSATALEWDPEAGSMAFLMGTSGQEYEAIYIPHGGARHPLTEASLHPETVTSSVTRHAGQLAMKGQDVFTFGLTRIAPEIKQLLEDTGTEPDAVDHLVLHQANQLLLDAIGRKAGMRPEQVPSSLYDYGNTSSATIPVTMCHRLGTALENQHQRLLLSGFGVGLSWGSVLLETPPLACPAIITL